MRALPLPAAAALLLLPALAAGQPAGGEAVPTIEELKAPSTPAATLLDIAPTSIERPDSARALVLNVISHVAEEDGVPKNFAVQLTPYWLQWHPQLTFDSYVDPTPWQRIVRSLAVSLASADWTAGSGRNKEDLGSRTAIGVSTLPFQGRVDPRVLTRRDQLIEVTRSIGIELRAQPEADADLKRYRAELAAALSAETDPARIVQRSRELADTDAVIAARAASRREKLAALERRSRSLARAIQRLDLEREGVRLAVAAAWSWGIPLDVFGRARRDRVGVWVTPSYRVAVGRRGAAGQEDPEEEDEAAGAGGADEGSSIEFIGVGRFLRDESDERRGDALDIGGRLVWQIRREIGLSAEVIVRRWRPEDLTDTYRAAGIFEAKLGDHAFFFAAFGRDYEERNTRSTLLSVLGINLGFGRKPSLTF